MASVAAMAVSTSLLGACDAVTEAVSSDPSEAAASPSDTSADAEPALRLNVAGDGVPVDRLVRVRAAHARLDEVAVTSAEGGLPGGFRRNGAVWVAHERLEPGTTYDVSATGRASDGTQVSLTDRFTTQDLALSEQTYASIAPLDGETVGIGMPVVVSFDLPVTDRTTFEQHMTVTSTPAQDGTWHWLSDTEVHWRPREYWQPGTEVSVDLDVNGLPAGEGIYGQHDRRIGFTVGESHRYRVDAQAHRMEVFSGGTLLRTIPITTGKEGFTTRSGVKVIMAKHRSKRMNSETVGIPVDSSEGYDLDNVEYAMRLTHSGEFIHAAPWSVNQQGNSNVSHGCTGMSTEDAAWLYELSRRGDVVEFVGTDRPMEPFNGYGDWNVPYDEYAAGSAL